MNPGVHAILALDLTTDEIILTIEAIAAGLVVLHPEVSDLLLQELPESNQPSDALNTLLTPVKLKCYNFWRLGSATKRSRVSSISLSTPLSSTLARSLLSSTPQAARKQPRWECDKG